MEILKGIKIVDLCLLVEDNLIIADPHIGYEESLNKKGLLLPRVHFKDQVKRLLKIIDKVKFSKVIINGDLKHEFGTISETEWRNSLKFLDLFGDKEIILIKGNHDTMLGPIAKKRNVKVVDFFSIGKILICHGDLLIDTNEFKTIIIGHEHPAITLDDGIRNETFKCYLKGKYEKKNIIVQPSFNLVTMGTDVMNEELLSPYLEDIKNFEVFVVEKEILNFGTIKNINQHSF